MLSTIFGSEVRLKLLFWFCISSSKDSYLANLTEVLDVDIKGCHTEIVRLEKSKIIKPTKIGKQKVYSLIPNEFTNSLKFFIKKLLIELKSEYLVSIFRQETTQESFYLDNNYQNYFSDYASNFSLAFSFEDIFLIKQKDFTEICYLRFSTKYYHDQIRNILNNKTQFLRFENEINYLKMLTESKLEELQNNQNLLISLKIKLTFLYLVSKICLNYQDISKDDQSYLENLIIQIDQWMKKLNNLKPVLVSSEQALKLSFSLESSNF